MPNDQNDSVMPMSIGDPTYGAAPDTAPAASPAPADSNISQGIDMSAPSPAAQAPKPQAAPEQPQPFWKSLLVGAIRGIAGSAGAKTFGGGVGAGAQGEIEGQQRDIQNKLQAAQSASGIRFQDMQSAKAAADINRTGLQIAGMKEDQRQAKEKFGMDQVDFNQRNFGTAYKSVPFTQDNARLYLQQASNGTDGAHIPDGVVVTPSTLYIPVSDSENSVASDYTKYKAQSDALSLNTISRAQYMAMNPTQRRATAQIANDIFSGNAQPQQVNSRINALQSAISGYANKPNADPGMLQHMKDVLSQYQHLYDMNQADKDKDNARKIEAGVASATARNDTRVINASDDNGAPVFARAGDLVGKKNTGAPAAGGQPAKPKLVPNTNGALFMGSLPNGQQVAGTPQELQAAGAQSLSKVAGDEGGKIRVARQLVAPNGLFTAVANDISKLEAQGQLGTIGSRWNDFMSGKVGSGPEFASLRANMGLLATALMQAHMGARGGSDSIEHFKHLADYRISDGPTLRAALSSEFKYATEKAAFIPKAGK